MRLVYYETGILAKNPSQYKQLRDYSWKLTVLELFFSTNYSLKVSTKLRSQAPPKIIQISELNECFGEIEVQSRLCCFIIDKDKSQLPS